MAQTIVIASNGLRAEISERGAELVRLQDEAGRDLLWDGDPAFWTGHAPLLFPIVGEVKDGHIKVDGVAYPMGRHGFARQSTFTLMSQEPNRCNFRLKADATTRAHYPFDFELDIAFEVTGHRLRIDATLVNSNARPLPASFGFHPALRWPLPYGGAREKHEVRFEHPEPEPLRELAANLMKPEPRPTPVVGDRLALRDDLFTEDALIFDAIRSTWARYGTPDGRGLRVDFPGMPYLGIWTKPGAGFVCIEPWHGLASDESFDGEFADKRGIVNVEPGSTARFAVQFTLEAA
jgi:galactose mutarotase-like enzyme